MKIVVIGGTGLIGSRLVAELRGRGHDAVPASPSTGVDAVTGKGLAAAVAGADVVADVSKGRSSEAGAAMEFFTTATRNVLAAERNAGVWHHVVLSIVGVDRVPGSGHYRAKVAQERLIEESGIPYSIVRATQFFEFVRAIADSAAEGGTVLLPPALVQPVAAADVVAVLAEIVTGPPLRDIVEVAGPEVFRLDEVARTALAVWGDRRTVITDPGAPYFGAELDERALVPDEGRARVATTPFARWLRSG
ncbi:SDR family oxidoreductase [Nonomuraea aridisoli]|uniref:NmrA family transcriptional regulator n=1 Tax=Nonomuraea aridisoli TaxID=2070368 RepID=A0A2W2F0W5_9ACTN|nr:SDR family oxidoreductase [Nonomuraea aridisoli]PZG18538.1 NmrA family transcriptional regulator [Nonomuraea aridisoli]